MPPCALLEMLREPVYNGREGLETKEFGWGLGSFGNFVFDGERGVLWWRSGSFGDFCFAVPVGWFARMGTVVIVMGRSGRSGWGRGYVADVRTVYFAIVAVSVISSAFYAL